MRTRLVTPILLAVLFAACGSGGPGATSNPNPPAAATATVAPSGKGTIDCAAIKIAAVELINVQFLAQLKTADAIAQVKSKQFGNLDIDQFLAAMHVLHALDSHPGVLGDPKAAIDFYEKAGQAAKVLFATEPVTQAAIDTYNQNVGALTDFLGHQGAISAAMGAAGC